MATGLHVTVPDAVYEEIDKLMIKFSKKNKSEFVSELLRKGINMTKMEMI